MRPLVILSLLASSPALAAPQCALQAPVAIPVVAQHETATSKPSVGDVPTPLAAAPQPAASLPQALASIPFVQHVASAGATVIDFGMSHGVRSISARNGDQFMIFQITPDGQAAVSGALTELTAAQLTTAASGNVTALAAQHGLEGLFVRSGSQFQVFYVTPDKERVVPGVLWDVAGKDLTRDQVSNVPGAIPTVVVGNVDSANKDATSGSQAKSALPLVERANFGTVGPASAPHLWMLVDPQCIYSVRAYQMLHPFIQAGKLQVSIVPIVRVGLRGQRAKHEERVGPPQQARGPAGVCVAGRERERPAEPGRCGSPAYQHGDRSVDWPAGHPDPGLEKDRWHGRPA